MVLIWTATPEPELSAMKSDAIMIVMICLQMCAKTMLCKVEYLLVLLDFRIEHPASGKSSKILAAASAPFKVTNCLVLSCRIDLK